MEQNKKKKLFPSTFTFFSIELGKQNHITPKRTVVVAVSVPSVEEDLEIEPSNGLESKSRPWCATGGNTDFPINIYDTVGQQLQPLCKVE